MNIHLSKSNETEVAVSDARAVNAATNRSQYKSRQPIYPKLVHGFWRRLKWIVMAITLGIYYILPWIRWDRGPDQPSQAVLIDMAHERFYFFTIELWPQEVYYITGLLILAALGIFTAASMFGRIWCGYACPQTVWTDLFIMVERLIEGDRAARIRLAAEKMSAQKLVKRVAKHGAWLLIAVATGGAFVFYFANAPTLFHHLITGSAYPVAYVAIAILTFTTYSLGGLMREQVCTYMCPWPRIQAALIDHETLTVTYRVDRGEPRGPHKKGQSWDGRGQCIDCRQCVAACPMGIDIRDGGQLECINCALCIDACDDVMARVQLPAGLIAYDTAENADRRKRGEKPRYRFFRPRTIVYMVVFVAIGLLMAFKLATRSSLGLDVLRDRNPTYVRMGDGTVQNGFTLKLMNHAPIKRNLVLSMGDLPGAKLNVIGIGKGEQITVSVGPDQVTELRALINVGDSHIHGTSMPLDLFLTDPVTHERVEVDTVFLSGD